MSLSKYIILICFLFLSELSVGQCFADFNYNVTGQSVQFLDTSFTSSGNPIYLWEFGDGDTSSSQNPFHTYSSPGSYLVILTLTTGTGCYDTSMATVHVGCQANFNYSSNGGNSINFNNLSTPSNGSTYNWDFGDGDTSASLNPTHTYTTAGPYTVSLSLNTSSGQNCTMLDTIYVNYCNASFIANVGTSGSATFRNFSEASPKTNYNWIFGDGNSTNISSKSNISHTYTASGTYQVTLNLYDTISGCSNTFQDSINIQLPCKAGFNYTQNLDSVFFQNQALNYQSLSYNFGDGSTSSKANPTHIYTQSGNYVVCQTVIDSSSNCSDTFCDTIQVTIPQCQAGFSLNQNIDTIQINNQAINFTNLNYDFGDGSSSNQEDPQHIYAQSGTYIVCQTVFDSLRNCSDSFCDTITVNIPQCEANFTFSLSSDTLQLTNQALNYRSLSYSFGDGSNSSSQENPQHIYAQSGTYIVCQTVFDSIRNCQDTFCDTIKVTIPECKAGFTYQAVGDSILFQSNAQNYTSIKYYFGDGDSSTIANPYHYYAQSNSYIVQQVVFDSNRNCTDSFIDTISVNISTSCIATFQAAIDTTNPGILYLINNSSDLQSHSYYWDFGDGTTGNGRTPTHAYSNSIAYPICLTVSDSTLGCISTFCDTIGLDSNGQITNKSSGFLLRVLDGGAIGLEEEKNAFEATTIYPNPAQSELQVRLDLSLNHKVDYQIIALNGKEVNTGSLENYKSINVSALSEGIYFLRLIYQEKSIVKKFIKQ